MKVVFVLFDTLVRKALDKETTPNFNRLKEKSITFDSHYTGSLPCMPARRDLQTGRMHFLHNCWGSLEPYDKSLPKLLREQNIHSHIITDHPHYFTSGGWGYCSAFSNWEFFRGQEGDPEKSMLWFDPKKHSNKFSSTQYPVSSTPIQYSALRRQHMINREFYQTKEEEFSMVKCFRAAEEFLEHNHRADSWFLQLECFDPHEPYYASERFRQMCGIDESDLIEDWLGYDRMDCSSKTAVEIQKHYKALLKMCDYYLGTLMDLFDRYNLWDDTMLVVSTDHGILLGEHDLFGKNREAYYEEISHIPLFISHPQYKNQRGGSRQYTSQTPDLMPTILEFFNVPIPKEVTGESLVSLLEKDKPEKRSVIFGMFGGPIGIADGEYVYYHYPSDLSSSNNLYMYTLMPEHIKNPYSIEELKTAILSEPFDFTQGVRLLKIKALDTAKRIPLDRGGVGSGFLETESRLFNIIDDPYQKQELDDPKKILELKKAMVSCMQNLDAPKEAYARFGVENSREKEIV